MNKLRLGSMPGRRARFSPRASLATLMAVSMVGAMASSIAVALPVQAAACTSGTGVGGATVTVDPCSSLATPTALVNVTGTGFTASTTVAVVECVPPVTSSANCDLSTVSFTTASATGTISLVGFVAKQNITTGTNGSVTCLPSGNCSVLASTFPQTATTPANDETIGFSAAPSPSPTPVVSPSPSPPPGVILAASPSPSPIPALPKAGSAGSPGAGSQKVGLLLGIAALLLAPLVVALARRRYQDHKPVA